MEGKLEKPSDILTVKEAIDLINSDSPTNRVVNNGKLIKNVEYLETNWHGRGMNYTIFLVKKNEQGKLMPNGVKWVAITNSREKNDFKYAVTDHYKVMTGRDINTDELGLMQQTTVVDDDHKSAAPRRNTSAKKLKVGDKLESGSKEVTSQEA